MSEYLLGLLTLPALGLLALGVHLATRPGWVSSCLTCGYVSGYVGRTPTWLAHIRFRWHLRSAGHRTARQ